MIKIQSAEKDNKKSIKRFYKANNYSASFMGYDTSYIALHEGEIIACVIISYISMNNTQALLHALCVDKQFRAQGIAKNLITHAQKHHQSIICFALDSMSSLYESLNFDKSEVINEDNNELIKSKPDNPRLSTVNLEKYMQYKKNNPCLVTYIYST